MLGRYIPEMGYLNVLLGVEPVLRRKRASTSGSSRATRTRRSRSPRNTPASTAPQRLFDTLLIPALALIETDRHKGALEPESERFAFDTTRQILEEIADRGNTRPEQPCSGVCIVPARDEADELAGAMLARLLPGAQLLSSESLAGETLERVGEGACRMVCISAVPPHAASHAAYRARRLRKQLPELKIVVALCTATASTGSRRGSWAPGWTRSSRALPTPRPTYARFRCNFAAEARRPARPGSARMIRVVRLGSPRARGEGLRLGTVRRPPRGVKKQDYARLDYYDVWLPDLAPSRSW